MPSTTTNRADAPIAISPATGSSTCTLERRRVHDMIELPPHALEQGEEAPAVERLDRALPVAQAEPVERRVREVEAVHREVHGDPTGRAAGSLGPTSATAPASTAAPPLSSSTSRRASVVLPAPGLPVIPITTRRPDAACRRRARSARSRSAPGAPRASATSSRARRARRASRAPRASASGRHARACVQHVARRGIRSRAAAATPLASGPRAVRRCTIGGRAANSAPRRHGAGRGRA